MKDDYVKGEVTFLHKTDDAVLVLVDVADEWVPRSVLSWKCERKIDDLTPGDEFEIELKEWKAKQIGLEY